MKIRFFAFKLAGFSKSKNLSATWPRGLERLFLSATVIALCWFNFPPLSLTFSQKWTWKRGICFVTTLDSAFYDDHHFLV